jgi:hypothetical protein
MQNAKYGCKCGCAGVPAPTTLYDTLKKRGTPLMASSYLGKPFNECGVPHERCAEYRTDTKYKMQKNYKKKKKNLIRKRKECEHHCEYCHYLGLCCGVKCPQCEYYKNEYKKDESVKKKNYCAG